MFWFLYEWEKKLLLLIYLKYRLYNYRGNFWKNIIYLLYFVVVVVVDLLYLKLEIWINMWIRKNDVRIVIVGDIRNCVYNDILL